MTDDAKYGPSFSSKNPQQVFSQEQFIHQENLLKSQEWLEYQDKIGLLTAALTYRGKVSVMNYMFATLDQNNILSTQNDLDLSGIEAEILEFWAWAGMAKSDFRSPHVNQILNGNQWIVNNRSSRAFKGAERKYQGEMKVTSESKQIIEEHRAPEKRGWKFW